MEPRDRAPRKNDGTALKTAPSSPSSPREQNYLESTVNQEPLPKNPLPDALRPPDRTAIGPYRTSSAAIYPKISMAPTRATEAKAAIVENPIAVAPLSSAMNSIIVRIMCATPK